MILHLFSELDELLRACGPWKSHRRREVLQNRELVREQLTDVWKYWMTVAQAWDFTVEDMLDAYWWKSMVVRQNYSQEWVTELTGPIAVIDIDNVLADYVEGFCLYLEQTPYGQDADAQEVIRGIRRDRPQFIQDRLDPDTWRYHKHQFRVSGRKRSLPVMPGAHELLTWCRTRGYQIALLSSRPIHRYPNLYADTLVWLVNNSLPFDVVWWATEKAELILDNGLKDKIVFALDDDIRFVEQFMKQGIRTYWLTKYTTGYVTPEIRVIRDVREIMALERAKETERELQG